MAHPPHHKRLPPQLDEPYYFLATEQVPIIQDRAPALDAFIPVLPAWIPQRQIAEALGHSGKGIQLALDFTGGAPYVWATEFENVHSFWKFDEAAIEVEDQLYACCESYYHSQKPQPFDGAQWDQRRVGVMRRGLIAKFSQSRLRQLLRSTLPHPLVSIKPDSFWGIDPELGGANILGSLLEEIRATL